MQIIRVTYNSTNKTARASCQAGSIKLPVDDFQREALEVAQALLAKLKWKSVLVGDNLPNGDFVFIQQCVAAPMFYQIFARINDRSMNPYRLVLLYNTEGTVVGAINYQQSCVDSTIRALYPSIKSLFGEIDVTVRAYKDMCNLFSDILVTDR